MTACSRPRSRATSAEVFMVQHSLRLAAVIAGALTLAACNGKPVEGRAPKESADEFVERTNREMTELGKELSSAGFAYATYINPDTEYLNAKANERYLQYFGDAVEQSKAERSREARAADGADLEDGGHVRRGQVLPAGS
jgi:hypothetical protein